MTSTVDDVQQRVLDIFEEVLGLSAPPPLDATLREDLSVSSMDTMTLVLTLEGEFDRSIEEDSVEALNTVGDVVALVRARVDGDPP